jgi:chromosomal replication initiator protein
MDDREIVAAIHAHLAERVGKDRYEFWFGPGTEMTLRGDVLVVYVRDQFFQDWLRLNFRKDLEAIAAELVGTPITLEFRVAAAPASAAPPSPLGTQHAAPAKGDGNDKRPPNQRQIASLPAPDGEAGTAPIHDRAPRRRFACLESFVVGDSNCVALKTAQIVAERPGTYSPLLLYGPSGTGKTHLLEGICSAFHRQRPRASTVYLSAEQFTTSFIEALRGTGLPNFRRKYRGVELLVVDDVQFFANKKATVGELLHTVDTLVRAGRQVAFAADRAPAQLKMLGPELISRLSGGIVCRLDPAEYATRLGIVAQLAAGLGIDLPHDVQAYIAQHFTAEARELAGAVKRLQATSLALQRPVTLQLAEEALAEMIDHHGRAVRLSDIDQAVRDVFGLGPASLQSGGKTKTLSHPRMLAMFLARKYTRMPLAEIGAYFGRRSHSTVISAQRKVESWMSAGTVLQLDHRAVSLEETLRRIEERLRAG